MSCFCDEKVYPAGLSISPGLTAFRRQVAGFPELREAMIADVAARPALSGWRPGGVADLGLMLIEMWAYLGDALAFQNEVHAHECYLRTARLRPSVRRLVDLLGYIPRPAVAATVKLAILAEGRRSITLPRGTSFRSGSFGSEAPQVFELDEDTVVHPLLNRWAVEPPRPVTAGDPGGPGANPTRLLLDPKTARLLPGDFVIVSSASAQVNAQAVTVKAVNAVEAGDGSRFVAVDFPAPLALPASAQIADVRIAKATQSASPWTLTAGSAVTYAPGAAMVSVDLDGIHRQIKAGQRVISEIGNALSILTVSAVTEVSKTVITGTIDKSTTTAQIPVTRLTLAPATPSVTAANAASIFTANIAALVFHHALVDAGRVDGPSPTVLSQPTPGGALRLGGAVEIPSEPVAPSSFQLRDKDLRSLAIGGSVDLAQKKLEPSTGTAWSPGLVLPVEAFGNIVSATRGESVSGEILGSGDASLAHQSFKLKKAPLTYVTAPGGGNASGVVPALKVRVSGVRWKEVPSFYGARPEDQVYIVRQNDAGESTLTFGDGVRGARLPTGSRNVVADYRFGAGKATPPAGSIQQLGRSIKGLTGVVNPIAAGGGDDAEAAAGMQVYAPRQALLLGRAVSLLDMEAVAAGVAGVRAARASWAWSGSRQRPVVRIAFIGSADPILVESQVRGMADPTAVIDVIAAIAKPVDLALEIDVDTDTYRAEDVAAAAAEALIASGAGLLSLERIGIGAPFYRSRLSAAVLAVPGARGPSVHWNGAAMADAPLSPGADAYFDVTSSLTINGKEYRGGE